MKKLFLLTLVMCIMAEANAAAQGFSTGARLWQANWEWEHDGGTTIDAGDELFTILYLGYHDGPGNIIFQFGFGDGWELPDDVQRFEYSLAGTLTSAEIIPSLIANLGLSLRRQEYDYDEEEWDYTGLEILLGFSVPLGSSGFSLSGSTSAGVYLWSYTDGSHDDDGTTAGYTLDGGITYFFDRINCSAGYRFQEIADDGILPRDNFSGAYVGVGFVW